MIKKTNMLTPEVWHMTHVTTDGWEVWVRYDKDGNIAATRHQRYRP